jgi:hypothetical protein
MRLAKALAGQESLEVFGMIKVLQLDVVIVRRNRGVAFSTFRVWFGG